MASRLIEKLEKRKIVTSPESATTNSVKQPRKESIAVPRQRFVWNKDRNFDEYSRGEGKSFACEIRGCCSGCKYDLSTFLDENDYAIETTMEDTDYEYWIGTVTNPYCVTILFENFKKFSDECLVEIIESTNRKEAKRLRRIIDECSRKLIADRYAVNYVCGCCESCSDSLKDYFGSRVDFKCDLRRNHDEMNGIYWLAYVDARNVDGFFKYARYFYPDCNLRRGIHHI